MTVTARLSMLLTSLCLAAVVAACQGDEQRQLSLQANLDGRTLVVEWGATLPTHAELFLSVWHVTAVVNGDERFSVDRTLELGTANQRQSFDVADWPSGEVHAVLTFKPLAQLNAEVIAAVGANGEKLTGPQLHDDVLNHERYLEAAVVVLVP